MTTWLAVGDETGNWDKINDAQGDGGRFLGVALVLAPWSVWQSLNKERIDDRSLGERMGKPLRGLPPRYLDRKETSHHVMPAFKYLRERNLHGEWSLAKPADDPVAQELTAHLRWLAFHRRFAVLGTSGPLDMVRELHQGRDSAQALGQVYGLLAALALPFLNPGDTLLVAPGPRSEPPDSLAWERARIGSKAVASDKRQDSDLRGLLTALEDTAHKALGVWERRPLAKLEAGTMTYFIKERRLGHINISAANAVADLGTALLAMCQNSEYAVRLDPQALGANLGFFRLRDLKLD